MDPSSAQGRAIAYDPDAVHVISTLSCEALHGDAKNSQKPVTQESVSKGANGFEPESRKQEMLNMLQLNERVKLEPLVLNRDSFAETSANILTLSLLVKDGLAQVKLAEDRSYVIVPRNAPDGTVSSDDTKSIFQFNYEDWELMRKQVQASEELSTHSPSRWPALIPKGIRKKARRRTCFVPSMPGISKHECCREETTATNGGAELSEITVEESSQVNEDPTSQLDGEATKPRKALLTYSRRRKTSDQLQRTSPMETLVKRYSRRMLNGQLYMEKTFIFQDLVSKNKEDRDTLFQTLASAPKRRRTGYAEAQSAGLYSPVSRSPAACALAMYKTAATHKLEGVESRDPMIITPKRFKKSNLPPRQIAIAQIKARLKAILNRKAPLK